MVAVPQGWEPTDEVMDAVATLLGAPDHKAFLATAVRSARQHFKLTCWLYALASRPEATPLDADKVGARLMALVKDMLDDHHAGRFDNKATVQFAVSFNTIILKAMRGELPS